MSLKNFFRSEGVYMYRFFLCVSSVFLFKIYNIVILSIKEKKKFVIIVLNIYLWI